MHEKEKIQRIGNEMLKTWQSIQNERQKYKDSMKEHGVTHVNLYMQGQNFELSDQGIPDSDYKESRIKSICNTYVVAKLFINGEKVS